MPSVAQINANRSNTQKSTGPPTPEGKAAVAQNAVKHGLLARAAVWQGEVSREQGPAATAAATNAGLAPWEPGSEFDLAWHPPLPPLPDRLAGPAVPGSAEPGSDGTNVWAVLKRMLSPVCQDAQAAEEQDE